MRGPFWLRVGLWTLVPVGSAGAAVFNDRRAGRLIAVGLVALGSANIAVAVAERERQGTRE